MVLGKVGLTGASGMLGCHLNAALTEVGIDVVAVSRTARKNVSGWDLSLWLKDEDFDQLFQDSHAVIHAGAITQVTNNVNMDLIFDANVRSCLNLAQWALVRNIPLVYISGAIVYKNPYQLNQKESAETAWNDLGGNYGFSKLLAEDILLRFRQKGLKLILIRPSSIYGIGMNHKKMISRFLNLAIKDKLIELTPPVEDCIDFVHAADISAAVVTALKLECWETFNISSGKPVSIRDLAQSCVDVAGSGTISVLGKMSSNYKSSIKYSLDISKARDRLGWIPSIDIYRGLNMLLKNNYLASTSQQSKYD
jgi:UDP-glucose 4-epimerase